MVFEHAAFIVASFNGIARMVPFLFKAVMFVTNYSTICHQLHSVFKALEQ